MHCDKCPCPDICLRWPIFCEWAAADEPDPVQVRHICGRSAMGPQPAPRATTAPAAGIPVAEAVELTRRMKACPFRSTGPGCGCSGGRCALKGGAIVSHRDCFPCVERYG